MPGVYLLRIASPASRLLTRLYHRLRVAGGSVPAHGPVLLVANHPNSLIDPAVVTGVARRPVRFLAKHTLFQGSVISWVVRGAGAIPVYRQVDDATLTHRNEDAFRAVFAALEAGSAVGIFPEGVSHSGSALAPLKTGAARIALGAAERLGGSFPIVPVGLTFERRDTFRSHGLVLVGEPVAWDDLVSASASPRGSGSAARELTLRIEAALRRVTVNLERWEDAPIVHLAEAIHRLETGVAAEPYTRIARLKWVTDTLQRLRAEGDARWEPLARNLARHERVLRRLRLRPADLHARPGLSAVARWGRRNVPFLGLVGLVVIAIGSAIFWPPYRAVAAVAARADVTHDVRSTYKLVAGIVFFSTWWLLLTAATAWWGGWPGALGVFVALPLLGLATLELQDRWAAALDDARRFALHRLRPGLVRELRQRQDELAERLLDLERSATPPRS
jgi:glycerol-3-phosphate O-acyltransferase / dihydroxyacetone phosphate acyltransferase